MPRTVLTVATTVRAGLEATYVSADQANGMEFDNSGEYVILHIINGNGGTIVVTIPTPVTVDGLSVTDRTISMTTTKEFFIGPFKNSHYGNTNANLVYVDFDIGTSVTLVAFKAGQA